MNEIIKLVHRNPDITAGEYEHYFTLKAAKQVKAFHETLPDYIPTPLVDLAGLAKTLGLKGFHIKDESYRFGLNAFKALGGIYCLARYISAKLGQESQALQYDELVSKKLGTITFVTATDGNHGRGIAWAARQLGHKARVFMPKGTVSERLANIQALGAEASITDMYYDDTVRFAAQYARDNGGVLVQDTAWEGCGNIPVWIMQGYMTMALEAIQTLRSVKPTHIFLQAGVGSMAGALAAFFADYYAEAKPVITIIEPNNADCFYRTARANDGKLHAVTGSLCTIMAGLACGEPCSIAWELLRRCAENFVSMPDYVAAEGMRMMGNPLGKDQRIISGESGASTAGFVCELMRNDSLDYIREELRIDSDSQVLCFSTEGDTDKENYRRIVWDGLYPSC